MNAPMKFTGGNAQAETNRGTHWFIDGRCADCDCRPWGRVAEWPCGVEPPRVDDASAEGEFQVEFQIYAAAGGVA